jgi:hypothetical protein
MASATTRIRCVVRGMAATLGPLIVGVGSDAQSPEPAAVRGGSSSGAACHAEVINKDLNVRQCPLAALHFHISADCRESTGTFVYQYLRVDPQRKQTVQRTAAWIAHGKEWDLTERVPVACDEEVDGAEVQRVTGCSCVEP